MFSTTLRNIIVSSIILLASENCFGFGVLTHEAIIDASWNTEILPLLEKRYPGATPEELREAHAHAYGGAVAPDMGYYPRGSRFFTDLVHYVRSGEMVTSLLKNAETRNQLAFALGFLAHYNADKFGHPLATNKSVPLVYPKLKRKFGNTISYADDELSHMRMEFGFDVLEVAKGNFASQSFREFIGFKVEVVVLAKAFQEVYGLDINTVHNGHFVQSVETFRWVVANIFPLLTRQAWATKRSTIKKVDSTATAARFNFRMRQRNYDKAFGTGYKRPGFFPTIVSFFIRILPKIGPLKPLKFKVPNAAAEEYFIQSFDTVLHHYRLQIQSLSEQPVNFENVDCDTGAPSERCEYLLADAAYRNLMMAWKKKGFTTMPAELRLNVLNFFNGIKPSVNDSKNCPGFYSVLKELQNHRP